MLKIHGVIPPLHHTSGNVIKFEKIVLKSIIKAHKLEVTMKSCVKRNMFISESFERVFWDELVLMREVPVCSVHYTGRRKAEAKQIHFTSAYRVIQGSSAILKKVALETICSRKCK